MLRSRELQKSKNSNDTDARYTARITTLSYRPISLLTHFIGVRKAITRKAVLYCRKQKTDSLPSTMSTWSYRSLIEPLRGESTCPTVFLDESQAFDRVWHNELLHKLRPMFPGTYCAVLQSYLENREFVISYGTATSNSRLIRAGVLQGSVIGPSLYLLYTADILTPSQTTVAMFADDTAIMATNKQCSTATSLLQTALGEIVTWFR